MARVPLRLVTQCSGCFLYEGTPIESLGPAITPACAREALDGVEPYQNKGGGTTSYYLVTHAYTVRKQ